MKANDPRLKDGNYKETLKKIREHFREDGKITLYVSFFLFLNLFGVNLAMKLAAAIDFSFCLDIKCSAKESWW